MFPGRREGTRAPRFLLAAWRPGPPHRRKIMWPPSTGSVRLEDVRVSGEGESMPERPDDGSQERLTVTPPKKWATGAPAVLHALEYSLDRTTPVRTGQTLLTMNQVGGIDCPGCAWADPAPDTGTATSTARTAPSTSTTRRPPAASAATSSASTRCRSSPAAPTSGSTTRAGSPSRWSSGPTPITTSRSAGTTPSDCSPRNSTFWTRPTRPSSTPRAAPATRPPSSFNCSPAPSAPTICPTAAICATSPAVTPCTRPSAPARARSAWRTCTTPT